MTAFAYAQVVVRDGERFSWQALERGAFDAHPDLADLLAADGERAGTTGRTAGGRGVIAVGAVLVMLIPFIAPGLLVFALRIDTALPQLMITAGVLSAVFVLARIIGSVRDARAGRPVSPQSALLTAAAVPFGALAAFLAFLVCGRGLVPGDWVWFGLLVAMTLTSLVSAVLSIRRGRTTAPGARTGGSSFDDLRAGIERLPDREQAAIRADLDRALDVLVSGGVLTDEQRAEADAAPLGGLARRQWALEQSRRRP
jgi:hypothetical protein